ncbi:MAG TPA: hypothetical protein VJM82_01840 [Nitrospiraceae bacterium]|nr:hypothetical protein [Nitrospiraceae bacterium]
MTDEAIAGHAGETGSPFLFPHELMGAIAMLASLVIVLIFLVALAVWLLYRIERHLRANERGLSGERRESSHPQRQE